MKKINILSFYKNTEKTPSVVHKSEIIDVCWALICIYHNKNDGIGGFLALTDAVVEYFIDKEFTIDCKLGQLIQVVSAYPRCRHVTIAELDDIVNILIENFKEDVKIVYGKEQAICGTVGSANRIFYGVHLYDILSKITVLESIDYGTSQIINDCNAKYKT